MEFSRSYKHGLHKKLKTVSNNKYTCGLVVNKSETIGNDQTV